MMHRVFSSPTLILAAILAAILTAILAAILAGHCSEHKDSIYSIAKMVGPDTVD